MDIFQIFILSLIQGLTEFLPISSTGHLILLARFSNIPSSLEVDAFLHLGSFIALLIYFWQDLRKFWQIKHLIILSTLPGGLAGVTLQDLVENYLRAPHLVALMMILMSTPMFLGEKFGAKRGSLKELTPSQAFLIGLAQALALVPGTSRSGITISAGLILGLKREEAAKFSFLAGAPLILGAGLYEGLKLIPKITILPEAALAGLIGSTISSLLAIAFLIPFLRTKTLYPFIIYRILLGLTLILFWG